MIPDLGGEFSGTLIFNEAHGLILPRDVRCVVLKFAGDWVVGTIQCPDSLVSPFLPSSEGCHDAEQYAACLALLLMICA